MNRLIEWSADMATGDAAIDRHNRAVVALVNELHESVHRRRGVDACRDVLLRLRDCALAQIDVEGACRPATEASDEERARLLICLNAMLARMDEAQSNITFHGLHELKVITLQRIRGHVTQDEPVLEEPAEPVKVFGLTLRRA